MRSIDVCLFLAILVSCQEHRSHVTMQAPNNPIALTETLTVATGGAYFTLAMENNNDPLALAIINKNLSKIRQLLATRVSLGAYVTDPNQRANKISYLQLAVMTSTIEVLEALIVGGADLNQTDRTGKTPLIQAIVQADLEKMELLLEKGALTGVVTPEGLTAVAFIQKIPSLEIAKKMEILIGGGRDKTLSPEDLVVGLYWRLEGITDFDDEEAVAEKIDYVLSHWELLQENHLESKKFSEFMSLSLADKLVQLLPICSEKNKNQIKMLLGH